MNPDPQRYEHSNSVVVPLAFFDRLMRCYYGNGAKDGQEEYKFKPENKSSQTIGEISKLKGITIENNKIPGYEAKGVAAKKLKAKQDGIRHSETTEEPDRPSQNN